MVNTEKSFPNQIQQNPELGKVRRDGVQLNIFNIYIVYIYIYIWSTIKYRREEYFRRTPYKDILLFYILYILNEDKNIFGGLHIRRESKDYV